MIPRLSSRIRRFLTSATSLTTTYKGKTNIIKFNNNSTVIRNTINQVANNLGYKTAFNTAQSNNNKLITKLGYASTAFNNWVSAKSLYDTSALNVIKYSNKLVKARRSRNTADKKKYTKLLNRAKTSKTRRWRIMNTRWNTFTTKTQEAGIAFLGVWNSYEDIKTKLLLP